MKAEIRMLQADDIRAVKEMSKLFWEGDDYLGRVAKSWVEDGGFLGMFEGDKLMGCAKITRLPDKVIWLEGLRIHPDFQSKGYGKELSSQVLETARQFVNCGDADYIEFSTYFKNEESIHLSLQAGFKQIDEYYILTHKSVKPAASKMHSRIHDDVVGYFPVMLPFGWRFLHPTKQAVNWLNKKVLVMRAGGGYFYVGGDSPVVCMLSPAGDWLEEALPFAQHVIGKKEDIQVMLHSSRKFEVEILQAMGFHWWDENEEDRVLIFRYQPD